MNEMSCFRKLARIAALALLATLTCAAASATEAERKPVRMLWAGSSSLYYHNQPKVTAELLTKLAGMPAVADLVGKSGTGVHVYLRPGFKAEFGLKPGETVLDKIARGNYDYLVLQAPAEFIYGKPDSEEFDKSLDIYCAAIRKVGAQPFFYEMGWGKGEDAVAGRQKIFEAAVRNQVTLFAPCSTAWARVRRERPDLELQNLPDTAHPGTLGLYLNLCCYYAAFTGKEPKGIPETVGIWPHLKDPEQKKTLAERVKATKFDEYDAALAGWMKNHVVNTQQVTLEPQTAAYLRQVAWEEWRAMQKRLAEAIAAGKGN